MSKRQKRRSHSSNRPSISTPAVVTNQPGSITSQPAASSWSPQRGLNQATEFNPDYSAVKKDLKRIGLLAGSFFVILIALTFILR
jgi:hypothetical protein